MNQSRRPHRIVRRKTRVPVRASRATFSAPHRSPRSASHTFHLVEECLSHLRRSTPCRVIWLCLFWTMTIGLIWADRPLWAADTSGGQRSNRPNVLLIIVDDLGAADLSCLGSTDMRTPHLDDLFARSLRLQRFYANCPVCSPTRASVLTGFYPDRVGVPGVIRTHQDNSWGNFSPSKPTLPGALQSAGYHTEAIGKWHLGLTEEDHPHRHGFDHFHGFLGDMMDDYYNHLRHGQHYMRDGMTPVHPEGHATDVFTSWAEAFISNQTEHADRPWFLYLAYNAPHTPIQPPQDWLERVRQRDSSIDPRRAKLVALIEHLDDGIGRVLKRLADTGQDQNTLVVFTSDNGGQVNVGANNGNLRDGKGSMYEGGLRIPGSLYVPPGCGATAETTIGSVAKAANCTADLMPTVLDLVGAEIPDALDGRSLVPMIRNPATDWEDPREIYFVRREGGKAYGGLTCEAVLVGQTKLVHNLPTSRFELFDLSDDPLEQVDLSDRQSGKFREMQLRLQRHIQNGGRVPWQ